VSKTLFPPELHSFSESPSRRILECSSGGEHPGSGGHRENTHARQTHHGQPAGRRHRGGEEFLRRQAAYEGALALGYEIVHPMSTETWGVRRFLVRAPDGNVINIVHHAD
jgi:hypothetical protein